MKVISYVASKGGAAKTTLVHNLATYVADVVGRGVLIVDRDPQKSLKDLWERRGVLINPRHVANVEKVADTVGTLMSAGYGKDYMMVDTPGSIIPIMRDAIEAADVVVMPTRPNPVDLRAQEDVIKLVTAAGKMDQAVFVLTQVEKGELADEAEKYLAMYHRPILRMPKRNEYASAQKDGRAGWEIKPAAKKDLSTIWEAITAILRDTTDGQSKEASNATADRRLH
jgi:chromosome partitioning protein